MEDGTVKSDGRRKEKRGKGRSGEWERWRKRSVRSREMASGQDQVNDNFPHHTHIDIIVAIIYCFG